MWFLGVIWVLVKERKNKGQGSGVYSWCSWYMFYKIGEREKKEEIVACSGRGVRF
jgi:hypothetical protein